MSLEEVENKLSLENDFADYKPLMFAAENHPKNIENIWKLLNQRKS